MSKRIPTCPECGDAFGHRFGCPETPDLREHVAGGALTGLREHLRIRAANPMTRQEVKPPGVTVRYHDQLSADAGGFTVSPPATATGAAPVGNKGDPASADLIP